jgi:hypothetical protein
MSTYAYCYLAATVMASVVLSSCASTQLSHTWRDASYSSGPLKKTLVVAVRTDQARRRSWEDGFAAELAKRGVYVTPSYRLIPETLPDTGRVNAVAREQGFDGILVVGRVSRKTTERVTSALDVSPPKSGSHSWGGWDYGYSDHEYYPGYPVEDETVKDQIRVWATQGGGRMIWTGVGEVRDDDPGEDVSDEMIAVIVPALVEQGVLGAGS